MPRNQALRAELLDMLAEDQAARHAVDQHMERDPEFARECLRRMDPETSEIGIPNWTFEEAPTVVRDMLEADRRHLERLRSIVHDVGWPSRDLVGDDAADACWLLVLHADADRTFQNLCQDRLREAVREGLADARQLAWLSDRLLMAERREQFYGTILLPRDETFVAFRFADPGAVDERRRAVGLAPLAEEIRQAVEGKHRLPMPSKEAPSA